MSVRALSQLLLYVVMVPCTASAQTSASQGTVTFNLSDLERAALERNTDLVAARQEIAAASGLLTQSRLRPNPGLDVTYGTGAPLGSRGERQIEVGYAHTFETGDKRGRRIDVGRVGVDLAHLQVAERERLLIADVKSRYADVLAAGRNLRVLNDLAETSERGLEAAGRRLSEGEASPLETALLQVESSRLAAERLVTASQGAVAAAQLKLVAGLDPVLSLQVRGDLTTPPVSITLDEAVQRALATRPDVRIARAEELRASAQTALARSESVPDVIGVVRYSRTDLRFEQFGTNSSGQVVPLRNTDRALTLGVSIPLAFANRNQGNIAASTAREQEAVLHRQFVEATIVSEVTAAYARYAAARQALAAFDNGVINQARAAMTTIRTTYDVGELPLLDVVQEQRRLVDTEKAYTDILREHFLAHAGLEQAIGEELR